MIEWIEGTVTRIERPKEGSDDKRIFLEAAATQEGYPVKKIQLHTKSNFQENVQEGSKILFYRDSASVYKFGMLLSDPVPISSPIWLDAVLDEVTTGEITFQPGEVALRALGDNQEFIPTQGGFLWLTNAGDGLLSSGSLSQAISVNDSSDSVDIIGNNIDISVIGNEVVTHTLTFDTSTVGLTSSTWGLANPLTGIFTSGIHISSVGSISIGTFDPILETSISGFGYNALTQATSIKSTATSITAASISLKGITSITGDTSVIGTASIEGATSVTGNLGVVGNTSLAGNLGVTGIVTLPAIPGTILVGTLPGFTGTVAPPTSITVVNGIVVAVS